MGMPSMANLRSSSLHSKPHIFRWEIFIPLWNFTLSNNPVWRGVVVEDVDVVDVVISGTLLEFVFMPMVGQLVSLEDNKISEDFSWSEFCRSFTGSCVKGRSRALYANPHFVRIWQTFVRGSIDSYAFDVIPHHCRRPPSCILLPMMVLMPR